MKVSLKVVVFLSFVLCVSVWLYMANTPERHDDTQSPAVGTTVDRSDITSIAHSDPTTNGILLKQPSTNVNPDAFPLSLGTLHQTVVPTGIWFKTIELGGASVQLQPLFTEISNAVLSVDQILKSKNYRVQEYSSTTWLVAEDKAHLTVWRIFPHMSNAVVNSVEAVVYQDDAMTQKDPSRSFEMSFQQEGKLHKFYWADKHEIVRVSQNETGFEYAKSLKDKMGLSMRWDGKGNLVSSNVYNWAKRGRVISGTPSVGKQP